MPFKTSSIVIGPHYIIGILILTMKSYVKVTIFLELIRITVDV